MPTPPLEEWELDFGVIAEGLEFLAVVDRPDQIIALSQEPIFWPEAPYETKRTEFLGMWSLPMARLHRVICSGYIMG